MNINELQVGDRVKYIFWGQTETGVIHQITFQGFEVKNDKGSLDGIVLFKNIVAKLEPLYKEIPVDSKNREDVKGKKEFGEVFGFLAIPEVKSYCKICGKYLWGNPGFGIDYSSTCQNCKGQDKRPLSVCEAKELLIEARRLILEMGESIDVPLQFSQHAWLNTVNRFI